MMRMMLGGTIAALAFAGASSAQNLYTFQWDNINQGNNAGGNFESITATYNDSTRELTWSATFSNDITEGFSLAINNGPNPKGHAGEMALLYFDAADTNDIGLTAYAYNGQNSLSSFFDGSAAAGVQTPDFIGGNRGAADGSWINSLNVTDNVDNSRTMSFSIDAGFIQDHDPMYPDPVDPWTGAQFDEKIGFWFHTFTSLDAEYDAEGMLTQWNYGQQGWLDKANLDATVTVVPLPPAAWAGLIGLVGVGVMRRRMSR